MGRLDDGEEVEGTGLGVQMDVGDEGEFKVHALASGIHHELSSVHVFA